MSSKKIVSYVIASAILFSDAILYYFLMSGRIRLGCGGGESSYGCGLEALALILLVAIVGFSFLIKAIFSS